MKGAFEFHEVGLIGELKGNVSLSVNGFFFSIFCYMLFRQNFKRISFSILLILYKIDMAKGASSNCLFEFKLLYTGDGVLAHIFVFIFRVRCDYDILCLWNLFADLGL